VLRPLTKYENLTAVEIKASVSRAQEINYLAAVKQAHSDSPTLDALLESWLPEVKEELSQTADVETLD